jgi:hypothetical protein
LTRTADSAAMDLVAVAMAIVFFAAMVLLVEGLDRL